MPVYHAPRFHFRVQHSPMLRWTVLLAILTAAASLGAWAMTSHRPTPGMLWAGGLWWAGVSALALHFTWHLPQGVLHWDGKIWQYGDMTYQAVRVHLDGQSFLLISLHPNPPHLAIAASAKANKLLPQGGWLWLERRMQPACWLEVRRAVYARTRPEKPEKRPPSPHSSSSHSSSPSP